MTNHVHLLVTAREASAPARMMHALGSMVNSPDEYRWSSFRSNADGWPDALVRRHPVYLALGRSGSARREAYRALFETPLEPRMVDTIRRTTNAGQVLGFNDSQPELERTLGRPLSRATHGGSRRRG